LHTASKDSGDLLLGKKKKPKHKEPKNPLRNVKGAEATEAKSETRKRKKSPERTASDAAERSATNSILKPPARHKKKQGDA
jgi:hypothetical protein